MKGILFGQLFRPATDNFDMGNGSIPFRVLERMGLWVIDHGRGGLRKDAVDAADDRLAVVTASGNVVYDSAADDFETFSTQVRAIARGETVTVRNRNHPFADPVRAIDWLMPGRSQAVAFRDGRIRAVVETSMDADRTMPDRRVFAFRHGQATNGFWREGAWHLDRVAHPAIRWTVRPWGYALTVHGVPIRIVASPYFGPKTVPAVVAIARALADVPGHLLRLYSVFRRERVGTRAIPMYLTPDFEVLAKDLRTARRLLKRFDWSPIGLAQSLVNESGPLSAFCLSRMLYVTGLSINAMTEAEYYIEGRTFLWYGMPDRHLVFHEIGHAIWDLLGGPDSAFDRELRRLFDRYSRAAQTAAGMPDATFAEWRRLASLEAMGKEFGRFRVITAPLTDGGWFWTIDSLRDHREFFAELVAEAFAPTPRSANGTVQPAYAPLVHAVRIALQRGKTPAAIRRIFREQMSE